MIKPILVVDLDDTLIKTDMLHETFWSAFSLDWKIIIKTFCKIFSCKAKLKKFLYSKSNVEVDLLPYNENIIKYIKEFRSKGGKTALVTASNQAVAQKIAHYLDIFDEVHGSSGSNNLKGENKAKFLSSHYKNSKFIYIGDSYTDLYVWKVAQKAITIGANLRLQNKVELINKNYEHLTSDKILISNFIKAMRPHQWLKNILVFLPMLAAHQLETQTFVKSIVAFFSFSFIASSVYIINDLLDLNADRAHSSKKNRPFASGLIPIKYGGLIAALLFIIGLFLASLSNELFLYTIFFYYFLTLVYSLDLKRIILVDIFCLAVLYTIRVIGGGLSSNINLTFWLLAFSIFFFLSLATVKRQAEIVGLKKIKKCTLKDVVIPFKTYRLLQL